MYPSRLFRIFLLLCIAVLAACDIEVKTVLAVSDLRAQQDKGIAGTIVLEVPSCTDFEDSRKPSDALLESVAIVERIFPDAQYKECYRKQMSAYAEFAVILNLSFDDEQIDSERINLISGETILLGIYLPREILARLAQAEERNFGLSFDFSFEITLDNDSQEDFDFMALGVFADSEPALFRSLSLRGGERLILKPSDVTIAEIMDEQLAPLLLQVNKAL